MKNIEDGEYRELESATILYFIEVFDYRGQKFQEIPDYEALDSLDDEAVYMGLTGEAIQAVALSC